MFIGYKLDTRPWNQGADFTFGDCLFVAAKNADRGKYSENRFDEDSTLLWASREFGKIIAVLGKDNHSSAHDDNRKQNIFIISKGLENRLHGTAIKAETEYSINITKSTKKCVKVCITMAATIVSMVMLWRFLSSKKKTLN